MTATAAPRIGVVERVGAGRILRDLLGDRVIKGGLTRCIAPSHDDEHPSMSVDLDAGIYKCHACGVSGGALDAVVLVGLARDRAEAARYAEGRYFDATSASEPAAPLTPDVAPSELPYPATAEALGWILDSDHGAPVYRVPVYAADGTACATKVRGTRGADGKLHVRLDATPDGRREAGLLNLPAIHACDAATPTIVLVAGETDLLGLEEARIREGIGAGIVSHSNGESASLGPLVGCFAESRVLIVYDVDGPGRKGAAARLEELRPVAASVVDVMLPFTAEQIADGCKDLRDWLTKCDGTFRKLLSAAEKPTTDTPAVQPRTAADLQDAWIAGAIKPRTWFLDGVFHRDHVSEIVGPQQGGKSILLWELAIQSTLPGRATIVRWPITPHPEGRPWRVGMVLGENDLCEFAGRLQAQLGDARWPASLFPYELLSMDAPPDLAQDEGRKWFEDIIKRDQIEVLVLDNLTSLCGAPFKDDETAKAVMGWLRRLARRCGVTVVMGVHTTKSIAGVDVRREIDKAFGSTFWTTWADSVLVLSFEEGAGGKPNDESNRRILRHAKARGPRQRAIVVELDRETFRFDDRGEIEGTAVAEKSPKGAAVPQVGDLALIEALRDLGDWTPVATWAEAANVKRTTLAYRSTKLHADKQIDRRIGSRGRLEYRFPLSNDPVRQQLTESAPLSNVTNAGRLTGGGA